MIRLAVKSGIAGGAVYYTRNEGVWDNSVRTTQLYEKITTELQPHMNTLRAQIPVDAPLLPSTGELCFIVKYYYNEGVKNTFYFIRRLPCYLGQWSKSAKDAITKALDQPPPLPLAAEPAALAPKLEKSK